MAQTPALLQLFSDTKYWVDITQIHQPSSKLIGVPRVWDLY